MKFRKNSTAHNKCDKCNRYSTYRLQINDRCIWQWLCDDHADMAVDSDNSYRASRVRRFASL